MDRISDEAAGTTIRDLDGGEHALRDTWSGRPAVLAFVRHFG